MNRIIDTMAEWYLAHFDEPLFMLAQGVILGLVIAGAVWMLCRAFKEEEENERND